MLNKYFVDQIVEITFILNSKKFKTRISDYTSPGEIELKINRLFFFEPTSISADADMKKNGKRKVQGVPQSQTAALPRPEEEEETDKSKQAQTEQRYEKH